LQEEEVLKIRDNAEELTTREIKTVARRSKTYQVEEQSTGTEDKNGRHGTFRDRADIQP
jgi:hypothetical protein